LGSIGYIPLAEPSYWLYAVCGLAIAEACVWPINLCFCTSHAGTYCTLSTKICISPALYNASKSAAVVPDENTVGSGKVNSRYFASVALEGLATKIPTSLITNESCRFNLFSVLKGFP